MNEEATAFKPGDTATLKGGGPTLTIERMTKSDGEPVAVVAWFQNGELKTARIAAAALDHYQ